MTFRAIEYAYGSNVVNQGDRANLVHAFPTKGERDTWVNNGPPDINAPGYRAAATTKYIALRSRHSAVRPADDYE